MAVSLDPHVRLRPSDKFLELMEDLDEAPAMPAALKGASSESRLTVEDVKWVYQKTREMAGRPRFRFHEVLAECEVILPEPEFAPTNPELEARCQ